MSEAPSSATIRTPDQRLRVFVSSTLQELLDERLAAKAAISRLHLSPVMFELGARPHPPRELYRSYLEQSHIFVGIYWQRYGWVAPGEDISGLEDEYRLCGNRPKLIYVKQPAPEREARLENLLNRVRDDDTASYKPFRTAKELRGLLENDLALLLTERFEAASAPTPPPTPAEPTVSALPVPPTPLVGRGHELDELSALLGRDDVRLVTLLGGGGVGKSRLALALAWKLTPQGGVHFVALAGLTDSALVIPTVADALGLSEAAVSSLTGLKTALRDEALVIVLDNFEQVMGAAPEIGDLLSSCPKLKLLVTSRSPLRLSAEHEWPVPPLEVPNTRDPFTVLQDAEAVQLFVTRARAVKPSFTLTMENAPVVAEITRRLDGLPLAIELAAARAKLLPPAALLKRLDRRFELLTGGARDLPDRHRTLKNTIDWSFELLPEAERHALTNAAVFAGGSTLEAAEAVLEPNGSQDVLDMLTALVDNNLMTQRDLPEDTRFGLLESVRAYALEKLEASGDAEAVRARHAEHFMALAEEAKEHLFGEAQGRWLGLLEIEHDNLRAALTWTAKHRPGDPHARLATALIHFWWIRGHYGEGRRWLAGTLDQIDKTSSYRGRALDGAGVLAWIQGDYKAARTLYEESLAIDRDAGDQKGIASSLGNLGIIALEQGDLTLAKELLGEALAINRGLGNLQGLAPSLINLSLVAIKQEDFTLARSQLEEALSINRRLGDRWGVTTALINLGDVMCAEGDCLRAQTHFEESLGLAQELGDKESIAYGLEGFAGVAAAQGRAERAARLWGAAEALREATGNPRPPSSGATYYQQDVALMRDELGELGFLEAWSEGRATPLEQVTAYALKGDDISIPARSTSPPERDLEM